MSFLSSAYFVIIGICLTVGLIHLFVFISRTERKTDLMFAVTVLSMAGAAYFEVRGYAADSVAAYVAAFKASIGFQGAVWIAFTWFVYFFTGTARRWLTVLVSALFALALGINTVSPYGILYSNISFLQRTGGYFMTNISHAAGDPNPWRLLPDLAWILMIYMAVESCVRLYRAQQKRRALLFGGSLTILLGGGYLHGTLVDLGVLSPPYLLSVSFIALFLFMSMILAGAAASQPEGRHPPAGQSFRETVWPEDRKAHRPGHTVDHGPVCRV